MTAPPHIIFDLDGTLVDSAPLCAGIINDMLRARRSARTVSPVEARAFMTRGGADTVAALLGAECGEIASELADFRTRYAARQTPESCLYPGVREGLGQLAELGVRMAVCSNKPQHLCAKVVQDLGFDFAIASVVGSRPGHALKPAADLARLALDELGADAGDCLFVGDSEVDQLTARAAGIPFLLVAYGYAEPGWSAEAVRVIDRFDELPTLLMQARGSPAELARVG